MEIVFELLFAIVFEAIPEIVMQLMAEVILELGYESVAEGFRRKRRRNPALAGIGLLLVGGLVGLVGSVMFPERMLPGTPVPGVSLVLSPLVVGSLMHLFGSWRRRQGREPSALATFWGGALFAFAMAGARWLMVGRA